MDLAQATLVAAFGGALVGILGTLGAQVLANQASKSRHEALVIESRRRDLASAVYEFVRATQLAEEAAAHYHDDPLRKGRAGSEMWIAQKMLRLSASAELNDAAWQLSDELNSCLWHPNDDAPHVRISMKLENFLSSAQRDGIATHRFGTDVLRLPATPAK